MLFDWVGIIGPRVVAVPLLVRLGESDWDARLLDSEETVRNATSTAKPAL